MDENGPGWHDGGGSTWDVPGPMHPDGSPTPRRVGGTYNPRLGRWVFKDSVGEVYYGFEAVADAPAHPATSEGDAAMAFFSARPPGECPCGRLRRGCPWHDPDQADRDSIVRYGAEDWLRTF